MTVLIKHEDQSRHGSSFWDAYSINYFENIHKGRTIIREYYVTYWTGSAMMGKKTDPYLAQEKVLSNHDNERVHKFVLAVAKFIEVG